MNARLIDARLIVNADDFGLSPGVTRGVVETMTRGIVSSTTLMANMPHAPQAAALAVEHGLQVGLHLNLTTGRPVSPREQVPTLVQPDGCFHPYPVLLRRLMSFRVSVREMYREFSAQVETALRLGIRPTHIDTHHHLHLWLPVALVMLRVGVRYGIDKTRTTRTTDMAFRQLRRQASVPGWAKRRYKALVARILRTWFGLPAWRLEASAFRPGLASPRSVLSDWLRLVGQVETLSPHDVVEVSCHPGYADDELRRHARYVDAREEEVAALTDDELKAALSRAGIRLVSFRDL